MYILTPMMNMKNGNTKSVGVKPSHSAWRNGAYIAPHDPGLFTIIIPAIVMPLSTSNDNSRCFCILAL